MMERKKITQWMFSAVLFSPLVHASELIMPNDFVAGSPAVAAEVNANSTATENAVNDNNNRITQLESALTALSTRIDQVEQSLSGFTVSSQAYYSTDSVHLNTDGTLSAWEEGAPGAYLLNVPTNYEYYTLPKLDTISFTVEQDNTTVIFQTSGRASVGGHNAAATLDVALRIDGTLPPLGAMQKLAIATDDNLSGASQYWNLQYPVQLNAGTHTFSVLVKSYSQNQATIGISNNRLDTGKVKVNVLQLKGAN